MAITAAELIKYASASMPESDSGTTGGAIATDARLEMIELASSDRVSARSNDTDTRTVTVYGRTVAGAITSENLILNGTTWVDSTTTFERILKIETTTSSNRIITIAKFAAGGHTPTLCTIGNNEIKQRRMFYDAQSGASQTVRYEKEHWKNTNGTLTLNAAKVTLTADPSAHVKMGLATTKNDSQTATNRITAPTGISFVDDNVDQNVPGTVLESGYSIGVWLEMTLAAGEAAFKSSFTTRLMGTTT